MNLITTLSKRYLYVFLLLGFPLFMNAQTCNNIATQMFMAERLEPAGIPVTSKLLNPSKSAQKSDVNESVASNFKRGFKVLILEREGDLYKVANSDLGRTMMIHSPDLVLHEDQHYSLVMRKLKNTGESFDQAEEAKQVNWEVVSGGMR